MSRHKKFSSIGRDLSDEIFAGHTYKTKRKIKSIAIHCSASPQGRGDDAFTIDRWHRDRWGSGIGYHYVILPDGTIQKGRWVDNLGAGVAKGNVGTIHICFIGGMRYEDLTDLQRESIEKLTELLISEDMYDLPLSAVKGHNEYIRHHNRGCPMIDMARLRKGI